MQNVVKQAFTETSASGTELTINNTIEARMEMKLNGNTRQNTTTGKNLLNGKYKNTSTQNGITLKHNNDNSFDITGTATSITPFTIISSIDQSNLVVGNTYYFYMSEKYDSTNLNVSLITNTPKVSYWTANKAYTIEENQKFNNLTLYIPSGVTMNYHNVKFMIVQGSTATSYEPYTGGIASPNPDYPQDIKVVTGDNTITISNSDNTEKQEFPISLGSLELCKIGDYQDYIYKQDDKWYKHKVIDKNTLNGTEKWHFGRNKTNFTTIYTSSFQNNIEIPANNNINSNTLIYCDKFSNNTSASQQWGNDTMSSVTINDGKNITFNIPNSIATTLDEFKTYLSSNNTIIYYVLATPIEEEITNTTLITQLDGISQALSKKGTTIISQSNDDLSFNLDVIALTK